MFTTIQFLRHSSNCPFIKIFFRFISLFPFLSHRIFKFELRRHTKLTDHRYWQRLARARRSLVLLESVRAWCTRHFKILFECRISTIWAIDPCVGNGLVRCFCPASYSKISCGLSSAPEIEGTHWVCNEKKWNGFIGTKIVPCPRSTPNSSKFSSCLHHHVAHE